MENSIAKIAITSLADEALAKSVEQINHGFDGGRVSKTDLASWLILNGVQDLTQQETDEIRRKHFNQVKYLESLVKKLKATGRESMETSELEVIQGLIASPLPRKKQRPHPSLHSLNDAAGQENKSKATA